MAEKNYTIVEYKEFPKQAMKTGYYVINRCVWDSNLYPTWWSATTGPSSMLIEYDTTTYTGISGEVVTEEWSYVKDKDGVATVVTLPDIDVKIPTKDNWILPLIAYSS